MMYHIILVILSIIASLGAASKHLQHDVEADMLWAKAHNVRQESLKDLYKAIVEQDNILSSKEAMHVYEEKARRLLLNLYAPYKAEEFLGDQWLSTLMDALKISPRHKKYAQDHQELWTFYVLGELVDLVRKDRFFLSMTYKEWATMCEENINKLMSFSVDYQKVQEGPLRMCFLEKDNHLFGMLQWLVNYFK